MCHSAVCMSWSRYEEQHLALELCQVSCKASVHHPAAHTWDQGTTLQVVPAEHLSASQRTQLSAACRLAMMAERRTPPWSSARWLSTSGVPAGPASLATPAAYDSSPFLTSWVWQPRRVQVRSLCEPSGYDALAGGKIQGPWMHCFFQQDCNQGVLMKCQSVI